VELRQGLSMGEVAMPSKFGTRKKKRDNHGMTVRPSPGQQHVDGCRSSLVSLSSHAAKVEACLTISFLVDKD
jgi:hypothetical protein